MEISTFISFFTLGLFIYIAFSTRSLLESHRSCCDMLQALDNDLSIMYSSQERILSELSVLHRHPNKDALVSLEARIQALNDHLAAITPCAKEEACEVSTAEKIKAKKKKL